MSGTHQYFTETGRPLPPPPLHRPSRSSAICELPSFRYDPHTTKESVRRHSLEAPTGGEFSIIPESMMQNSQLVTYSGSNSASQQNPNSNNKWNGTQNMNDTNDSQQQQHRRTHRQAHHHSNNSNNRRSKSARNGSNKEATEFEDGVMPSQHLHHTHRHRRRKSRDDKSRLSKSQSFSRTTNESDLPNGNNNNNNNSNTNNNGKEREDTSSQRESEEGIPHRGRGPVSLPKTSATNRENQHNNKNINNNNNNTVKEKGVIQHHHHHNHHPQEQQQLLSPQQESPYVNKTRDKEECGRFNSAPVQSHVHAARQSRERAEHVARHPHLPVTSNCEVNPDNANTREEEVYKNEEKVNSTNVNEPHDSYYIHKAHDGVNNEDNQEVSLNYREAQCIITPQEIDKEEEEEMLLPQEHEEKQNVHAYKRIVNANDNNNDNNDKNAASTRGGVPELHVSNVNGKPQSKSNGHVSPATHDNVKTEASKHRREIPRTHLSSKLSLESSTSSSSLVFSSSSSSEFSSSKEKEQELLSHTKPSSSTQEKQTRSEHLTKPTAASQAFVRSPSEAAARFRAAHTSGPVSIPLHHPKNTNTPTSNKSHFNDNHNLTENDYCTPQKESDTNVTNNTGDKVRPVRRGSREDHMISLQTPKHPHESPQSKKTPNSNNDKKEVNANYIKEKNVLNGERKEPISTILPTQSSPNTINNNNNYYYNKEDNAESISEPIANKTNKLQSHEPFFTSPTSILHEVTEGVEVYNGYVDPHIQTNNNNNNNYNNKVHNVQHHNDNTNNADNKEAKPKHAASQPKNSGHFRYRQPTPPETSYKPFVSQPRMSLSSRPASRFSNYSNNENNNNNNNINSPKSRTNARSHRSENNSVGGRSFRRSMSEHLPLSARVRARSQSRCESEIRRDANTAAAAHRDNQSNESQHYNSVASTIGGTELLPSRPLLQGMRCSKDNRALFTISKFVERQPTSTRNELEDMLIEYEGREEELCEVLAEIYGEDFEAQRQMLLMDGSVNEIASEEEYQESKL